MAEGWVDDLHISSAVQVEHDHGHTEQHQRSHDQDQESFDTTEGLVKKIDVESSRVEETEPVKEFSDQAEACHCSDDSESMYVDQVCSVR